MGRASHTSHVPRIVRWLGEKKGTALQSILAVVLLYDLQFEVASCLFPDYCRIAQLVMAVLRCHYFFSLMCLYCPTFAKLPDALRVPVQVGDLIPPPETNHHPNATIGKSKKIKYTKSNVDKQARNEKECNKPTLNLVPLMALSVALVTFFIVMRTMLLRKKCFSLVNFVVPLHHLLH